MEPTTLMRNAPRKLEDDVLARFRRRAAQDDRENRFLSEDLADLEAAGYLRAALPTERGGWGLDLAELALQQRRIARYSPATALSTSMHHYWVGAAVDLDRLGHPGIGWVLDDVAAGEIFASGHAEAGNDVPIALSTTRAQRTDGGYRFSGRKHFTSLSPVWTRLGAHAVDTDDPAGPTIVHGFVTRESAGVGTVAVWDTLGMRATQSHDTVLGAVVPAGDLSHPFTGAATIWALTLIANVYLGIAERAFELAVDGTQSKTAISLPRGTFANHPFIQHQVAEMYLRIHPVRAMLDSVAADWSASVDHGEQWGPLVMSAKWHAAGAAQHVVSVAMDVVGGGAFFRRHELERLYRDARAGGYHPPTDAYAHEAIGKAALGVSPDAPRW
ncbi:MAG: acyl-CoA dehydrogenase [Acidimicrobiia bacterium]|nr:acyl-CoA dehydrogenase [Acidimicrobiia bacterium]